jgi:hypothetical protein
LLKKADAKAGQLNKDADKSLQKGQDKINKSESDTKAKVAKTKKTVDAGQTEVNKTKSDVKNKIC